MRMFWRGLISFNKTSRGWEDGSLVWIDMRGCNDIGGYIIDVNKCF